ncbi:hypothetical protein C9994_16010 [Marivirga lumbricoides]|uniref:Outer membrane protein beta-barrel domain-containing protein n=1 Tax=Marivirga lumbricoides TaxID=1046115 RepID=A0A2T4DBI2_9BACT|nr:hypothetical protein C9994_16010 [Marivirga lumbricoides]
MKRILLLSLLAFQINVYGQDLTGKIQLGGTGSFFIDQTEQEYAINSFLVQDEFKTRTISIIPQLGYFVSDKVLIGGRIGYSNVKVEQFGSGNGSIVIDNEIKTSLFKIGPYARFHKSLNEQLLLFMQGNIDVGFGTRKNGRTDETVDESIFEIEAGVRPGILLMVSDKVGIESTFGFLGYKLSQAKLKDTNLDPTPTNKDQDFGLDLNLNTFSVGIQFYF